MASAVVAEWSPLKHILILHGGFDHYRDKVR